MKTLPTIIGLKPEGKAATCYNSITRKHLLIAGFVFLGILSFSLLIAVIVQAKNHRKNDNSNADPSSTPSTTTTSTAPSNTTTDDLCLTSGCISAAAYQLRSIDSTASASICADFYKFACGGWQQTHPIQSYDVERTIIGDIIDRRDHEIQHLLGSPVSRLTPDSWEYKIKTYYTECLDDYTRQPDSGKYMIAAIRDPATIDGWFVLDNSADNASQEFLLKNQSIYTQLEHIHGDMGVLAIFGLRTRYDEFNPNVKRLEFFPAGLTMEINDYLDNNTISEQRQAAYQQFILEVLSILAQEAGVGDDNLSDRTFTVANDVSTVETFFAERLKEYGTSSKPSNMTLQEMSEEFSFDFVGLIQHELDDPTVVTPTTPVYVNNIMYFTDAFEYLGENDDPLFARMIHNYLRWRLLLTYIEDLSYSYIHSHRVFLDAYYGYTLHSSNEEYCEREVRRRFPLAVERLYTMNSTRNVDAVNTVQNVFNLLKDGFKDYLNNHATWMPDSETKNLARQKVDALTSAIGYATIASDDNLLDQYYQKFTVSEELHLQNAIGYGRFHRWSLSASIANPNIIEHWDLFETRTTRLFDYIAVFNRLFVIASGMHEPLVSSQWPIPVNLGSIGVLLAQKLFASIDVPEGRMHLANGTRNDWWASPTITAYNNSRNCITDYYVQTVKSLTYNINGAQVQVNLAGEPFSPTTLRHIGALRLAYDTLIKNNPVKSFRMPGTNLTSEQTFFLSYAQTQCYQRQELLQFIRTQLGIYDEQTALNAALVHMPEFTRAFHCQTKMNNCFD